MYDEDDFPGPTEDPFDQACREAARRLAEGEPMTDTDWEALHMLAMAELDSRTETDHVQPF